MSECRSTLFSVSNSNSFPFTLPDTHQSLVTGSWGWYKEVYFCCNAGWPELGIRNRNNGKKYAFSCANKEGYQVNVDSQGTNILTGYKDEENVYLKMLEVYEIECLSPPKQPDIPSEAEIKSPKEEEERKRREEERRKRKEEEEEEIKRREEERRKRKEEEEEEERKRK
jgi:hypothetical protein